MRQFRLGQLPFVVAGVLLVFLTATAFPAQPAIVKRSRLSRTGRSPRYRGCSSVPRQERVCCAGVEPAATGVHLAHEAGCTCLTASERRAVAVGGQDVRPAEAGAGAVPSIYHLSLIGNTPLLQLKGDRVFVKAEFSPGGSIRTGGPGSSKGPNATAAQSDPSSSSPTLGNTGIGIALSDESRATACGS